MGANQSSRKITVVNDEATGVIKISDAVVNRLKEEITGTGSAGETKKEASQTPLAPTPATPQAPAAPEASEPKAAPPPPPAEEPSSPPPPPPPAPASDPPSHTTPSSPPPSTPPSPPPAAAAAASEQQAQQHPNVWQRPIIQYIEEPSLSALKVRQEKEEEMKALEEYWKDRLQKQQAEHVSLNKLTEEEAAKSVNTVEKLFTPAGTRTVCREERDAVQSCYQTNSGQSLRCRDNVSGFIKCVTAARFNTSG